MKKNIKFGIKIALHNFNLLNEIYNNRDVIDYIEVILPSELTIKDIKNIKDLKMAYALHLPTSKDDFNLGDIKRKKKTLEIINNINQFEEELRELNPISYIVHPASGDNNLIISNLKKLKISPIALENMPFKGIYGYDLVGYDVSSLKPFFNEIPDLELCFDINHAIKAALTLKRDYSKMIKEILSFRNPIIFHISDGSLEREIDEHLSLCKGEYDLREIKKILAEFDSKIYLTFETPRNYDLGIEDVIGLAKEIASAFTAEIDDIESDIVKTKGL